MPEFQDFPAIRVHKAGPFLDGDYWLWGPVTRPVATAIATANGLAVDPERGFLWLQPLDCAMWDAKQVTAEVLVHGAHGFEPCEDCVIWYPSDGNTPDVALSDLSTRGVIIFVGNVPARQVMIVVRDTASRLPVSVLWPLMVAADQLHLVLMVPASASALARLPAELR